jgi:uncharacterized protein (DUF302 family)
MVATPTYGFVVTLDMPLTDARPIVEAALKEEGFGVLTEIDVKSTLKQKIDVDFEPYVILGACNPGFAHQALTIQPAIGLLLPCNVTLHEIDGQTRVSLIDPLQMLALEQGNDELMDVAKSAEAAFRRVEAKLSA